MHENRVAAGSFLEPRSALALPVNPPNSGRVSVVRKPRVRAHGVPRRRLRPRSSATPSARPASQCSRPGAAPPGGALRDVALREACEASDGRSDREPPRLPSRRRVRIRSVPSVRQALMQSDPPNSALSQLRYASWTWQLGRTSAGTPPA